MKQLKVIKGERIETREPSAPRERLKLVPWSAIHLLPKRESLVDDLLDAGGFSVVFGASGAGKTFFVQDLSAHITLGWEWRGRQVKQGAVVYIAAEGGSGFTERLTAFRHHHEVETEGVAFYVIAEPINLCQADEDTKLLVSRIEELESPPVLIVVDTLSRSLAGGNENASDDMGAFVQRCDKLRATSGAHVMVIHHTGKDDNRGARGHSLLKAAADTEIEVRDGGAVKTATVTKQRDLPGGESFPFKLQPIDVEERQACVLVPADASQAGAKGNRKPLSKAASIALKALRKAADEVGTIPPASNTIPANTKTVSEDQWRKTAYALGISTGGDRAQQGAFQRGSQALIADEMAVAWMGHYWPCI